MASAAGSPVVILDDGEEEEIRVMAAPALGGGGGGSRGSGGTVSGGVVSGPIDVDVEVVEEAPPPRRAAAAATAARGGSRPRPRLATADDAELVVLDAHMAGGGGGEGALVTVTPAVAGGGAAATTAAAAAAAPGCDVCGAAAVSRGSSGGGGSGGGGSGGGGGGVPVPWVRVARCRHGLCSACALGAVTSTSAAGGGSRMVGRDGPATAVVETGASSVTAAAVEAAAADKAEGVKGASGAAVASSVERFLLGGEEEGGSTTGEPLDDGMALLLDDVSFVLREDGAAAALLGDTPRSRPAGAAGAALEGVNVVSDEAPSEGARATPAPAAGDAGGIDVPPPPPPMPSVKADPCCPVGRCRAPLAVAEVERCLAAPDADTLFGPVLTAFGTWYDAWTAPKDVDAPLPVLPWLVGGGFSDGSGSSRLVGAATAATAATGAPPLPSQLPVAEPRSAVSFQIGLVLFDGEEDDGSWLTDDLPAAFGPLWVAEGGGLAAAVAAAGPAGPAAAPTAPAAPAVFSVDNGDDSSEKVAGGGSPSDAVGSAAADSASPPPDPLSLPAPPLPPPQPPTWRCALCGGGAVPRPSGPAGRHPPAWVHCALARAVGVVEIVRALRKSLAYSSELESELTGADDTKAAGVADGGGDIHGNGGGEGGLEAGGATTENASIAAPVAPVASPAEAGQKSGKRRSGAAERTPSGRGRKRPRSGDAAGSGSHKARNPPQARGFVKGTGYGGNKGPEWKAKGANLRARDAADDATTAGWLGRLRCFLLPPREAPPRAAAGLNGSALVGGGPESWPPYLRLLLRRTGLVTVLGHVFMNGSMMELGQRAVLYTASLGVVTALTSVASLSALLTEHITDAGATVASLVDGMARQVRVLSAGAGAANLPPATGALVKQVRRTMRALNRAGVLPGVGGGLSGGGSGGVTGGGGGGGAAGAANEAVDGGNGGDGADGQAAVEAAYVRAMKRLQFETVPDLVGRSAYRAEAAWQSGAPGGPAAKGRLLRLSQEVASLSGSLPLFWASGVLLRVDEDRFDVLRALVFGPEGTPYAHGAFVFDFFLPAAFPRVPPLAKLLTTGGGRVRFNPNLYKDGRVCLSLLGTWAGPSWTEASTLLQVLVSIQSLILVAEPYFNEPGYESSMGTPSGRAVSERYNVAVRRNTVVYAMTDALRRPPPEFRHALRTHFRLKATAIRKTVADWVGDGGGGGAKGRYPLGSDSVALTAADVAALDAELDKLTVGPQGAT